jgi:hypothetical protein
MNKLKTDILEHILEVLNRKIMGEYRIDRNEEDLLAYDYKDRLYFAVSLKNITDIHIDDDDNVYIMALSPKFKPRSDGMRKEMSKEFEKELVKYILYDGGEYVRW